MTQRLHPSEGTSALFGLSPENCARAGPAENLLQGQRFLVFPAVLYISPYWAWKEAVDWAQHCPLDSQRHILPGWGHCPGAPAAHLLSL